MNQEFQKCNFIAINEEQRPLIKLLSGKQVARLVNALFTVFVDGEDVDFSDDQQLDAFWPSFYGPMSNITKKYATYRKASEKRSQAMKGNQNARKK